MRIILETPDKLSAEHYRYLEPINKIASLCQAGDPCALIQSFLVDLQHRYQPAYLDVTWDQAAIGKH